MPRIDGAAILSVWERCIDEQLGERALTLLTLRDGATAEDADMAVGERDAELLRIRRRIFGDAIEAVSACEACGDVFDIELSVDALLRVAASPRRSEVSVDGGGAALVMRVPNAGDLAALRGLRSEADGVALLIDRCVRAGAAAGSAVAENGQLLTALDEALADADPGAEIALVSSCLSCGARNEVLFDIASFLHKETEALARDVLEDVHALARGYGWDEGAILALSPARRRFYLGALDR